VSATKARILAALAQFAAKAIEVPEMGGTVYVRPLTVAGMARIHAVMSDANQGIKGSDAESAKDATMRARERTSSIMLMDCIVDETGARIFADSDEALVAAMPGKVAEVLLSAIESIGGLTNESPGVAAGN
jgi:hypothetical protein